jgi:hypothetical protein
MQNGKCVDTVALATRLMAGLHNMERGTQQIEMSLTQQQQQQQPSQQQDLPLETMDQDDQPTAFAFSQPLQYRAFSGTQDMADSMLDSTSFSQPENEYFTATQCQGTLLPGARLTRFYSRHSIVDVMTAIHAVLEDFLVPHKVHAQKMVSVMRVNYFADISIFSSFKDHLQHG